MSLQLSIQATCHTPVALSNPVCTRMELVIQAGCVSCFAVEALFRSRMTLLTQCRKGAYMYVRNTPSSRKICVHKAVFCGVSFWSRGTPGDNFVCTSNAQYGKSLFIILASILRYVTLRRS